MIFCSCFLWAKLVGPRTGNAERNRNTLFRIKVRRFENAEHQIEYLPWTRFKVAVEGRYIIGAVLDASHLLYPLVGSFFPGSEIVKIDKCTREYVPIPRIPAEGARDPVHDKFWQPYVNEQNLFDAKPLLWHEAAVLVGDLLISTLPSCGLRRPHAELD